MRATLVYLYRFIGKIVERLVFKILDLVEFDKLLRKVVKIRHASKTISLVVSYIINTLSLVLALSKLDITTTIITTVVIVLLVVLVLFVVFGTNDLFANLFSGIVVRFRKTIRVDDLIRIKDAKKTIEGKVLSIGHLSMRIENDKNETIYVPNMLLFKSVITKIRKKSGDIKK